jgi:hypothetical protein
MGFKLSESSIEQQINKNNAKTKEKPGEKDRSG